MDAWVTSENRLFRINIDCQIDVAVDPGIPPGHRAEHVEMLDPALLRSPEPERAAWR